MTDRPFVSFARNGEDVVLLRALGGVPNGRFLEFGPVSADDPPALQALLDLGWSGIRGTTADLADPPVLQRHLAAIGAGDADLHAVVVSTDLPITDAGAPPLGRLDLSGCRPWVVVIGFEPTARTVREKASAALAAQGYRFCHFDGVSAYYVAADREGELGDALAYPACARDNWLPAALAHRVAEAERAVELARHAEAQALESVVRWRERAVRTWADASAGGTADPQQVEDLRRLTGELATELEQTRRTLSWRVTAPLRTVRRMSTSRSSR